MEALALARLVAVTSGQVKQAACAVIRARARAAQCNKGQFMKAAQSTLGWTNAQWKDAVKNDRWPRAYRSRKQALELQAQINLCWEDHTFAAAFPAAKAEKERERLQMLAMRKRDAKAARKEAVKK